MALTYTNSHEVKSHAPAQVRRSNIPNGPLNTLNFKLSLVAQFRSETDRYETFCKHASLLRKDLADHDGIGASSVYSG